MVGALAACSDKDGDGTATTTAADGATSSTPATTSAVVPTTSAVVTTQTTAAAAVTLDCDTVGFTPATEDAASSIRATGLSCEEARSFVREAGAVTSSGGPAQVEVQDYRCIRTRSLEEPIPQAFYECTDGDRKVTYVRT